jgi:hypothetical protein
MKRCLALLVILVAACRSGAGTRCQVDTDCTGDLKCNATKGVCENTDNNNPIDAVAIDTSIDAPIDAAVDAPID